MELEIISTQPDESQRRPTPLMFVHGGFTGAWCWEENFLPFFSQHGYTCYALSLRGHGKSPGRFQIWYHSIADYVADLKQVVEKLNKPPVLVGHSMGGMVIQKLIESFRVPAAVLLASVSPAGLLPCSLELFFQHPLLYYKLNAINMLPRHLWSSVVSYEEVRALFFSSEDSLDKIQKYFPKFQHESYRAVWDMLWLNLPRPEKITTPFLILGGKDDVIIPPSVVISTAKTYNTQAHIFPCTGHAMMVEKSWKTVAQHIVDWLNQRGI
jgi:pimeloyl-ACP methyl ester carboxylesterase